MSDEQTQVDTEVVTDTDLQKPDEKAMLMQRARIMGITFSNAITVEKLKEKIEEKLKESETPAVTQTSDEPEEEQEEEAPKNETVMQMRARLRKENLKLIRLRITCLDPKKKDLPGEIFTVSNKVIGTVRKYVPYGEVTDNGWHVPYVIYKMMKRRQFLQIRTVKNANGRGERVEQNYVREFALEVLPPLTEVELAKLAAAQAAAGGVED